MNLLATATVLVLGLAGGREILSWWHEPADSNRSVLSGAEIRDFADPLKQLRFGSTTTGVLTAPAPGDRAAARTALRALCVQAAESAPAQTTPPGPGEQKLLTELSGKPPLAVVGALRVDELAGPVPMMAASTIVQNGPNSDHLKPQRLAALGIAVPAGEQGWTVYAFCNDRPLSVEAEPGRLRLPPHSVRTVSLGEGAGQTLTAFHGRGKLEDWEQFFRAQLEPGHWEEAGAWQTSSDRRLVVLTRAGAVPVRCELQFGADGRGELWGIVTYTTRNTRRAAAAEER
ncbi:MAG TPA: hypothetical protein VFE24_14170 [Pirellulales bacterium]|nr:hypothetical protein [Pirellulales bacterium]